MKNMEVVLWQVATCDGNLYDPRPKDNGAPIPPYVLPI